MSVIFLTDGGEEVRALTELVTSKAGHALGNGAKSGMISRGNQRRTDLVVCFITSVSRTGSHMAPIAASPETG